MTKGRHILKMARAPSSQIPPQLMDAGLVRLTEHICRCEWKTVAEGIATQAAKDAAAPTPRHIKSSLHAIASVHLHGTAAMFP